jgi:hypothetical protein
MKEAYSRNLLNGMPYVPLAVSCLIPSERLFVRDSVAEREFELMFLGAPYSGYRVKPVVGNERDET